MRKKLNGLYVAQQISKERGGKCLSTEYINNKTKLLWECEKNHLWKACLGSIKDIHTWCPDCSGKFKLNINIAKETAKAKDGQCLSTEYINNNTRLLWQCKEKHKWKTSLKSINNNTWCPYCAGVKLEDGLEAAQKISNQYNGKCLSTEYINSYTKMKWQCKIGHIWMASYNSIQSNKWCPKCASKIRTEKHKLRNGLELAKQIAEKHDGKCLSTEYINNTTKMKWKCKNKHIWRADLASVKNSNSWCPECAQLQRAKSQNNSYILCHWKTDEELICQASWEKKVVEYFNRNRINFRWQSRTFRMPSGKTYRPDLYLFSTKKWIEIKGYFRKDAKEKWDWFQTVKPNSELWDRDRLKEMNII